MILPVALRNVGHRKVANVAAGNDSLIIYLADLVRPGKLFWDLAEWDALLKHFDQCSLTVQQWADKLEADRKNTTEYDPCQ